MLTSLPVLIALTASGSNTQPQATPPAPPTSRQAEQMTTAALTIKCPITGEQIPSCCCPVKK